MFFVLSGKLMSFALFYPDINVLEQIKLSSVGICSHALVAYLFKVMESVRWVACGGRGHRAGEVQVGVEVDSSALRRH